MKEGRKEGKIRAGAKGGVGAGRRKRQGRRWAGGGVLFDAGSSFSLVETNPNTPTSD